MATIIAVICFALMVSATGELLNSYSFPRSGCLASSFANQGVLKQYVLQPTNTSWQCPRSNGLLSTSSASSVDLGQIQASLQNRSFSFELWLAPARDLENAESIQIANFGGRSFSDGRCGSSLLQLSQVGVSNQSFFQFGLFPCNSVYGSSASLLSPQYLLSKSINGDIEIVHLVINVEFERIEVNSHLYYQSMATTFVLNGDTTNSGQNAVALQAPFDATTWDARNPLMLFPTSSSTATIYYSDMILYYFGLWNQTLSDNQIQTQYNNSMSLSEPVTYSTNATVLENGQVNDESRNPAFFTKNVSSKDLAIIAFGLYNLNQDPISPNYPLGNATKSQLYLTSLLSRSYGRLYYLNGSSFGSSNHATLEVPWVESLSSYALRYRPPYNTYSTTRPIAEIDFYAKDKLTNSTSSVSTLSVYVQRVVKPPVATPTVLSRLLLARKVYTIQLNGSPDVGQIIVSANITQLPLHGDLYMIRGDGSQVLMSNDSENTIRLMNGQLNVIYMFTGKENASHITTDYFSFLVQDNSGLFSLPVNVTVSAVTSLLAIEHVFHAYEDRMTGIQINGGIDQADTPRTLRAILRSQPNLGGYILNFTSLTPYHNGETFAGVIDPLLGSDIAVYYQPPLNYFTTPNITVTGAPIILPLDQFEIQITDDTMTAYSSWATQSVVIRNVNDPTTISRVDDKVLTVQTYSDSSIDNSVLTIYNFTVIDPDLDTNRIRVSITTTEGGYLSLAPDAISEVDFNSYTYCNVNGYNVCQGDGFNDLVMFFVTSPSGLAKALNGLSYINTKSNVYDTVNITIYDGEGGRCLNRTLLDPITIFEGCLTTTFQFQVYVQGPGAVGGLLKDSISHQFLSTNLKFLILGLIALIAVILIRWYCLRQSRHQQRRKGVKQDEKQSPAPKPERQKRRRQPEMKASLEEAADDDYDEEEVVIYTRKAIPTTAQDHYPKMISLADITTPPRRNRDLSAPPSSSRSRAVNEMKQQSLTDSETRTKSAKSSKKNASTTGSSTPTKANSLATKSNRRKRDHLSATTQDLGITSSPASASAPTLNTAHRAAVNDTRVLGGSSLLTTAATRTAAEAKDEAVTTACVWTAHRHSSGRTYYYNKRTKKSVWVKPEDFV